MQEGRKARRPDTFWGSLWAFVLCEDSFAGLGNDPGSHVFSSPEKVYYRGRREGQQCCRSFASFIAQPHGSQQKKGFNSREGTLAFWAHSCRNRSKYLHTIWGKSWQNQAAKRKLHIKQPFLRTAPNCIQCASRLGPSRPRSRDRTGAQ